MPPDATFKLHEASDLTGLTLSSLRQWVERGFVRPYQPGQRGRGKECRISERQLLALAVAAALRASPRGCSLRYVQQILAHFEGFTPQRLESWLGAANYADVIVLAQVEEGWAASAADAAKRFPVVSPDDLPDHLQPTVRDVNHRLHTAEQAIRARRAGQALAGQRPALLRSRTAKQQSG